MKCHFCKEEFPDDTSGIIDVENNKWYCCSCEGKLKEFREKAKWYLETRGIEGVRVVETFDIRDRKRWKDFFPGGK